jgi:peroxiredoxin Q/BCP
MLSAGDKAPAIQLPGDDGKTHTLAELGTGKLVLYFYPKDATPGCTVQAHGLRDHLKALTKLGARVVGVSPDSVAMHARWAAKEQLGFTLLSDPEHVAAEKYGVWQEKTLYGRKFMGIVRSTFVIEGGRIVSAEYKVSPKEHAERLVAQLSGKAPAAPVKKPRA